MKLFISHASADRPSCEQIARTLEPTHEVWYGPSPHVGKEWRDQTLRKLEWCEGFVCLLSPAWVESEHCQEEYAIARQSGKPIFPVKIQPNTNIPDELLETEIVDFSEGLTTNASAKLIDVLAKAEADLLRHAKQPKPAPVSRPGWLNRLYTIAIGAVIGALGTVIVLIATRGFGLLASAEELPTPTATSTAELGVTRNADWEPSIQEFGGVPMALVPAGCFMMGSTNEQVNYAMDLFGSGAQRSWFSNEQPAHRVCFDEPFWIDVMEITNGQYGGAHPECLEYSSGDNQPRVCVTWDEAQAYCQSRGARLPTEAEWEYAARGPDGLVFPWGNTFNGDLVIWNASASADVGSRPGGASWVGALDMSGNVWEWVNDWYSEAYYGMLADGVVNPQGPDSGEDRVMRGGSWYNYDSVSMRSSARSWYNPSLPLPYLGFRCALSY